MAETKKTFPMLPIAHWWSLRKKFQQSIPGVVTDGYLATVLNMGANSARANVLPFLKVLGIIDADGKPSARAKAWRDDDQYPKVCQEMIKEIYPEELTDAIPDPTSNRDKVKKWFANHTGTGEAAAKRMAALYTVLSEADASKEPDSEKKPPTKKPPNAAKAAPKSTPSPTLKPEQPSVAKPPIKPDGGPKDPDLNINLQIHISADASTDQIEQIFASMAKHIYRRA